MVARTEEKPLVELTDLRSITRNSKHCRTTVTIQPVSWDSSHRIKWLVFGEMQLQHMEKTEEWTLAARMTSGITDFEHDSAHAFKLPLVGLVFESYIDYSNVVMNAWIHPDSDDRFRVPRPGYDPTKLRDARLCSGKPGECKFPGKAHMIVPEGCYAGPPHDLELYNRVRGKRVEIRLSPKPPKEDT